VAQQAGTDDPYPATPDQLIDMMSDAEYVNAKYTALKDKTFKVTKLERSGDGLSLEVDREVEANLPDFVKKVLGETNRLIQREQWSKSGDGYTCDVVIDSPGKPMKITGTMAIRPDGAAASKWKVDFTIKGTLPMMGKIEKVVAQETQENLAKEYEFNKGWLANH
jgi:hypothetical protein